MTHRDHLTFLCVFGLLLAWGCGDGRKPASSAAYDKAPTTPVELEASDGTFEGKVVLSWKRAQRAASYNLYKAIDAASAELRLIARDIEGTSFADTTVTMDRYYFYRVSALNNVGESEPSEMDRGFAGQGMPQPPKAPDDVSATDGDWEAVTVTWDAVAAASTYSVYRCRTPIGEYSELAAGLAERRFLDDQVELGIPSYYRVSATNADGEGPLSEADEGFAVRGPPAAPSQLSASDGDYVRKVLLSWETVEDASAYSVYRSHRAGGDYDELRAGITNSFFEDLSVSTGTHYFYRLSASNKVGESPRSPADEGFAASDGADPPDIPLNVSTSEDIPSSIAIEWDSSARAKTYKVYRGTNENDDLDELAVDVATTHYEDSAINEEEYYFYQVKAVNEDGESLPSELARGYALIGPPAIPEDLVASDGAFYDKVSLRWVPTARAASYRVYRSMAMDGPFEEHSSGLAETAYDDYAVELGTRHFYRVSAVNTTSESEGSSIEEGHADLQVPGGLSAAKGSGHWNIALTWHAVEGAESYRVYRRVYLGAWVLIAEEITEPPYLAEFAYLAQLRFRVSAVRGSYEGELCEAVARWTAY